MFRRLFSPFANPLTEALHDARVHIVQPAEVRRWLEAGEAVIVDVREANEYVREHIAGSTHIPLSLFDPGALPTTEDGRKLVIHCANGNRCAIAAQRLLASGFQGPINRMLGGLNGWKSAGGPVVSGLKG